MKTGTRKFKSKSEALEFIIEHGRQNIGFNYALRERKYMIFGFILCRKWFVELVPAT